MDTRSLRISTRNPKAFWISKKATLYPALYGLEAKYLITSYIRIESGRTRCCYKLTNKGKKTLAEQMEEWHPFAGSNLTIV
jgi:DNA-binding PadR family transcriptional regulator